MTSHRWRMRTSVLRGKRQNEKSTYDVYGVVADAGRLTAESHGHGGQHDPRAPHDSGVVAGLADGQTDEGGRVVAG